MLYYYVTISYHNLSSILDTTGHNDDKDCNYLRAGAVKPWTPVFLAVPLVVV
jgi:hypothetical protein